MLENTPSLATNSSQLISFETSPSACNICHRRS